MAKGDHHPPAPDPIQNYAVIVYGYNSKPIVNAQVVLAGLVAYTNELGAALFQLNSWMMNTAVIVRATGYDQNYTYPVNLTFAHPQNIVVNGYAGPTDISLPALTPDFPAVPTREQVCGINLTFQGLTVQTKQFGTLPWFGACLAWLNEEDRKSVYNQLKQVGDKHCIISLPSGPPLYDEPNQPYSADRFGPLDWTNNDTQLDPQFINLVKEVIRAGLIPMIFCLEIQERSLKQVALIIDALKTNNLTKYCLVLPGWDGVFYGWTNDQVTIPQWAATARFIDPNCYLGIEHNPGHIPLGEGGGDYLTNGKMKNYDVVISEFDFSPGLDHTDQLWQIVARMIKPYIRPSDQPASDDPNPPFYLVDSERGPRYYCAFEWSEYLWVRDRVSKEQIDADRAYLKSLGCKYTG